MGNLDQAKSKNIRVFLEVWHSEKSTDNRHIEINQFYTPFKRDKKGKKKSRTDPFQKDISKSIFILICLSFISIKLSTHGSIDKQCLQVISGKYDDYLPISFQIKRKWPHIKILEFLPFYFCYNHPVSMTLYLVI